jgi:initiation factor 1A
MVINISGGNKAKKQKRTIRYEPTDKITEGQLFGIILDKCGGCHFRLMCSDGRIRNGKLSGRMANGPRINTGSYVILSLRDFEKDQKNCDIIGHASPSADIIRILKSSNNNNKQKDDINFKDSDDEFDDFNNDNDKVGDNNKASNEGKESDITFEDIDKEDTSQDGGSNKDEGSDGNSSNEDGGGDGNNDVWEDKEENTKKNITKDEIDDLIDLL